MINSNAISNLVYKQIKYKDNTNPLEKIIKITKQTI